MPGDHEPASKGSFYFSLATSTIRAAIIVALVVGGLVVLTKAFPQGGEPSVASPGGKEPVSGIEPKKDKKVVEPQPETTPEPTPCDEIKGVSVVVFNGTAKLGLAAEWSQRLFDAGWVLPQEEGNSPQNVDKTVVYFRGVKDKRAAECLQEEFFPKGSVKRLPPDRTDVQTKVRVAVDLGLDATRT